MVGDVADVAAVHLFARAEVALNEIAGQLGVGVSHRRGAPTLLAPSLEAGRSHEPAHPSASAAHLALTQLLVDARRSIGALGLGVNGGDLLEQLGVGHLALRRDTVSSLVVGGTGDLEQATGVVHAVTCDFLRLDERVHRHRVSRAKKAVARLSVSLSISRRRFTRRNRVKHHAPRWSGRGAHLGRSRPALPRSARWSRSDRSLWPPGRCCDRR